MLAFQIPTMKKKKGGDFIDCRSIFSSYGLKTSFSYVNKNLL